MEKQKKKNGQKDLRVYLGDGLLWGLWSFKEEVVIKLSFVGKFFRLGKSVIDYNDLLGWSVGSKKGGYI